jgi:hypothetical protein
MSKKKSKNKNKNSASNYQTNQGISTVLGRSSLQEIIPHL